MKRYHIEKRDGYDLVINEGGAALGISPGSGMKLVESDGWAFKDPNGDGTLEPYEDWRLTWVERARDLAARLSVEQIAGLMLYSPHQSAAVPDPEDTMSSAFAGTYAGRPFGASGAAISDLTDQQIGFLTEDGVRHVLVTAVQSPADAAKWNNNMQRLCEGLGMGIPVNISSDPRHGADAGAEFNAGSGGAISHWPSTLGLAATFDPSLVRRFGEIASCEYRAMGITTALSPQIDLAGEPRWFRFSGTFGEGAELVCDLARAYCDGFQTTDGGWGSQSVNTMVKHWPGGGSGEGGRDAHFFYGKYAVYPGSNFEEGKLPFTSGAFALEGGTGMASAVMPYYTISDGQDTKYGENVGNGYSRYIIGDLLRGQAGYDGVVCTDWNVTHDWESGGGLSGMCWGTEELSEARRHYKALMAGVDQFGGNSNMAPVIEAYRLGAEEHGEEKMRARFETSAVRLLMNMLRPGLLENPYTEPGEAARTVGCPEYTAEGYAAMLRSVVLLKNKNNALPAKRCKVFIPKKRVGGGVSWFGVPEPVRFIDPVPAALLEKYFDIAETPQEADMAVVFISSPSSRGWTEESGYLPLTLQYRPYTAKNARERSLAGGHPGEDANRSYRGKTNTASNEYDLDTVLETKKAMGDKPVIVSLDMSNPTVVREFEQAADAIVADFGCMKQAVLDIVTGACEPSGLLPCQMPADMETVEEQKEDVMLDMRCHRDENGNTYDFGFGLSWSGVISDARTQRYVKRSRN